LFKNPTKAAHRKIELQGLDRTIISLNFSLIYLNILVLSSYRSFVVLL